MHRSQVIYIFLGVDRIFFSVKVLRKSDFTLWLKLFIRFFFVKSNNYENSDSVVQWTNPITNQMTEIKLIW